MDWTGLDWTGLTFCTKCTLSMQLQVVYCVCYYFEEALQPCIPTVILKNHVTVAKQEGGGEVAGLSALFAD